MAIKPIRIAATLALLAAVALVGCKSGPALSPDGKPLVQTPYRRVTILSFEYQPEPGPGAKDYAGKPIVLSACDNQAENTHRYGFYSVYGEFEYGNDMELLSDTVCNAFLKAIGARGMQQHHYFTRPPGTPTFDMHLVSMTDHEFRISIDLYVDDVPRLKKVYTVTEPRPTPEQLASETAVKERAYGMLNEVINAVFTDPEFKKIAAK